MAKLTFGSIEKDSGAYDVTDVAFALELIANGDTTWQSTDNEEWNTIIKHAVDILRLHHQSKEKVRE